MDEISKRLTIDIGLYKSFFDESNVCMVATDSGFKFVEANTAFCNFIGYTKDELLKMTVLDITAPEDRTISADKLSKQFSGEITGFRIVKKYVRKDGQKVWGEVQSVATKKDSAGENSLTFAVVRDITREKTLELELRESMTAQKMALEKAESNEHFLQRAQEVAQIGSYILDTSTGRWSASKMLDEIFGIDSSYPHDVTGWSNLIQEGHRQMMTEYFQNYVLGSGNKFDKEYIIVRQSDKAERWVHGLGDLERDGEGKIIRMIGTIQDVTEEKILRDKLRQSDECYRGLFDSVKEAIYIQDQDGKFLDVNKGAEKMYGHPREWFVGKTPLDVSAPGKNDLENVSKLVALAFAGEPQEFEFWGIRSNGEIFPKDVRVYKGKYFGKDVNIAMATDISERKKSETALMKERARLEAVLEGVGVGVFVVDEMGKIMMFNTRAEILSGIKSNEAMGRNYWEIMSFSSIQIGYEGEDFIRECIKDRQLVEVEKATLDIKNRSQILVSTVASPVVGKDGIVVGTVVIFRDITRRVEAERLKDEFVMIASHELRSPLTAIKWAINTVLDGTYGQVSDIMRTPLVGVSVSTDRLIRLVNDMISLTRLEGGSLKFNLIDFDVRKAIDGVLATFESATRRKGVIVEVGPSEAIAIRADVDATSRIINNLFDNALKFTPSGGKIQIEEKRDGDYLYVDISDTGAGIPKEGLSKLFTKFGQASKDKAEKTNGTGLGLYISRQLARSMGGDLTLVWTEEGKGSKFQIKLLLSDSESANKFAKSLKDMSD